MARLQTQSVRAMRPMLEEAQQTLPKSVDNGVLNSLNYITKAGAGLAAAMRPQDFSKLETQTKNVMAVMQHMDMRQRSLNNQQRMAHSQHFSDAYGSVHAERSPLRHADIARQHQELRNLVAGLRPDEQALVANAQLARQMRGFADPAPNIGPDVRQAPGF